jgi:hypothetical protein
VPLRDEEVNTMGSRLVLGASTVALVMVASGGTAFLVTHGARQLQPPQAAAPAPQVVPRPAATPLILPPAPGSALFGPGHPAVVRPVAVVQPPAAQDVTPDVVPAVPPVVGPVAPPVVEPPVMEPPLVEPPVVERPVVRNPLAKPAKPGHGGKNARRSTPKTNNGNHYGQLKHPKG